jgi:hypothetical protein
MASLASAQVNWNTGSGGGNWITLNPTTARVGVGTSNSSNPSEKLTVAGGNVLVDNNRWYRGKLANGTLASVIGLDANNNVSIYGGKVAVGSDGKTSMGNVLISGNLGVGFESSIKKFYVLGASTFNGQINVTGGQLLAEGGLQSLGDFWSKNATVNGDVSVGGKTTMTGNLNVNGTGVNNIVGRLEVFGLTQTASLNVFGNLSVSGSKNFVHPHPSDDTKKIVYVAAEAGEALTMARGISRTENGQVTVQLPDHFALVTSEEAPLTVQLTVEGAPALIYVVSKSREAIEVKMKGSDFAEFQDVTFNYFVQGIRDGFEDHIAIQDVNSAAEEQRLSPKRARYEERVKTVFPGARKRPH